jgi:hypothetical protein
LTLIFVYVQYDVADLIRATRETCGSEAQFDWATLGSAAGACFRSAPEISFLFGLMDTKVVHKERKKARRTREDDDVHATQPSEYTSKVCCAFSYIFVFMRC